MSTSGADWTFNKLHSMCLGSAGGSINFYVKTFITNLYIIIVGTHLPPPCFLQGEGGWASNQIFIKGGAWQDLNF